MASEGKESPRLTLERAIWDYVVALLAEGKTPEQQAQALVKGAHEMLSRAQDAVGDMLDRDRKDDLQARLTEICEDLHAFDRASRI